MEHFAIILVLGLLLFWGWGFTKRQFAQQEDYSLYLIVKNQENYLEGIIRYLFYYLQRQEVALRLHLIVEESEDQTLAIAQRLGRHYSFEVIPIKDFEQWLTGSPLAGEEKKLLLDLRKKNQGPAVATSNWAE